MRAPLKMATASGTLVVRSMPRARKALEGEPCQRVALQGAWHGCR